MKKKKGNVTKVTANSKSPNSSLSPNYRFKSIQDDPALLNNYKVDDHSKTMKLENQELTPKVISEEHKKQMRD
jgi:hypothetical protein